ncbi:CENP-Q, a CENPA-CAD centromere complex subunit-domain-containing protein [Paraphoma chrysanthemicola]|uniref:CENP-Q, a CENPA-CAD centromere complex subunit-domain-containing protein n=1 Tax=Paraphoma chrysanthemicola TaxID=798071 RepID=A0A8K0W1R4_9PLEO|nr:CENP-Q, a CENPA-CAD centromere complex subunit-domain-containing protein [Paraphoma chrysanthemicola]
MAPKRSGDNGAKKRRGRPPGSRKSDVPKSTPKGATKKTTSKRRKAPQHDVEAEDELSGLAVNEAPAPRPKKRKANPEHDEIADDEPKSRKTYVQLEARTKRIPQEQIETWPKVSPQVLEQMVAVIRDAKKDIANTQRDERRVIAAHNTLNPLVRKLARQLAASRIPPQAKDIHFNIDKLTERNAQVSREVTTARHSKQLLTEQVKVAEHLVKKDEENLEQLKKDAKRWRTEWKHQEKHGRIHPLLLQSEDTAMHSDGPDDIGLRHSVPVETTLLDTPDDELAPVLEQLRRSLENMQGNHAQVDGVDGAMRDAQAALDDVLFRHASTQQYATL